MAKIIDPDNIAFYVNGTEGATTAEFYIETGAKTIAANVSTSDLDDLAPGKTSGATGRALYSALKIAWLASTTLRKYKFPIKMIFEGSFIVTNGWAFLDQQTRDVMRDAGFQEALTSDNWSCMVSLGEMFDAQATPDYAYYTQVTGFVAATTSYDKAGEVNENIDITTNNTYQKSFLRVEGKLSAEYALLIEQGLSSLNFQAYSFPLANGDDLQLTNYSGSVGVSDAIIGGGGTIYDSMKVNYLLGTKFTTWASGQTYIVGDVVLDSIRQSNGSSNGTWWFCSATTGDSAGTGTADDTGNTWESYDGEEQIGTEWYAFNRVVTCNTGTNVESYAYMQYQLRQVGDINADDTPSVNQQGFGTVNGEVAELLGEFVGDNLKPKPGVLLRGFDTNSTNNIQHYPISVDGGGLDSVFVPVTSVEVPFPFVAAGNFNFSKSLADENPDSETVFDVYFEYITRTSGSYTFASSAGQTADLTWASTDLDHIEAGDYLVLSGWTTPANDGEYLVNTVGANTMNVTIQDVNVTLTDETATVQVDENPFGSLGAIIVNDNDGNPMTDIIGTAAPTFPGVVQGDGSITVAWDFDYTNNNQGGRSAGSDAAIHVIALALDTSEWAESTHTVTAATGQNISINGNDERNFSNPA